MVSLGRQAARDPALLEPQELEVDDGLLRFNLENDEDIYQWGTLPDDDDPPVFGRFGGDPWDAANVRLSEHMISDVPLRGCPLRRIFRGRAAAGAQAR